MRALIIVTTLMLPASAYAMCEIGGCALPPNPKGWRSPIHAEIERCIKEIGDDACRKLDAFQIMMRFHKPKTGE
jgi:hypothetical protein